MSMEHIRPYPRFKAAGFKTDCETLLRAFQQTQSVRFSEFAKLWREKKFSFIFGGRISEKELMEFAEDCILIALSFALPPHNFQWRTGGLYLLYALYLKQPQPYKVPIRVTLENWNEIQEYIEEVKEQTHHDIHYVFRVLEVKNAFQFVAFHKEHNPTNPSIGCYGSVNPLAVSTSSVLQLVEDGFLQHLEILHQNYVGMKSHVVADDSVNSISDDVCVKIAASINMFEDRRTKGVTNFATGVQEKDEEDSGTESKDIGRVRRDLKQRSLQLKASTIRSRRNRAVVMDSSSVSPKTPSRRKNSRRKRRISGKSNTSDSGDGAQAEVKDEAFTSALSMPSLINTKD